MTIRLACWKTAMLAFQQARMLLQASLGLGEFAALKRTRSACKPLLL